jgi:hypothetical protein
METETGGLNGALYDANSRSAFFDQASQNWRNRSAPKFRSWHERYADGDLCFKLSANAAGFKECQFVLVSIPFIDRGKDTGIKSVSTEHALPGASCNRREQSMYFPVSEFVHTPEIVAPSALVGLDFFMNFCGEFFQPVGGLFLKNSFPADVSSSPNGNLVPLGSEIFVIAMAAS